MSGTGYNPASQQIATNFQGWLPPQPLPTGDLSFGSQWAPNTPYGAAQAFGKPLTPLLNILAAWVPPDPLPTVLFSGDVTALGAGATFTIFHPTWQPTVLASWVPPDPTPTLPITFGKRFTASGLFPPPPPVPGNLAMPPHNIAANGAMPVFLTTNSGVLGAVPRAGVNNTITVAGQAILAVTGPINGGFIYNPPNAASQGISVAEDINLDMTGPPVAGDAAGFGTTSAIVAGQTFNLPPLAPGVQVWVNAVTVSHRFTVVVW